ncbi:hypothetical protein H6G96_05800 [Nostoc sp. FACHB-892]|uniref:hypothetical protein n=1 Tax=Nostoc sp. FACHB-892 TaxID=2692843 RepID=UPI00168224D9|nr:hypothetical protein [Nostoc sp. FACHB-892]MBD2725847.1 hypothetical protein [Nostoc sp. FACHB-892]
MESTLFTALTVTEEASLSGGTVKKAKKEHKVKKYKDSASKYLDLNLNIITNAVTQTNVAVDLGDVDKIEQKNTSNITNVIAG